jgi:translation initiation factor IF-3
MPVSQALNLAREQNLDLVEVAPNATPPVCRILDYGKYRYEQSKKEKDARKHQRGMTMHEVRFSPKIGDHDMEFKLRTAERLLSEGDRVKITVRFRGREMTHLEIGRELLERAADKLKAVAVVERPPNLEGRFMSMIMVPTVKKVAEPKTDSEEPAVAQTEA